MTFRELKVGDTFVFSRLSDVDMLIQKRHKRSVWKKLKGKGWVFPHHTEGGKAASVVMKVIVYVELDAEVEPVVVKETPKAFRVPSNLALGDFPKWYHANLARALVTLPRGSAAWRKEYARYRRTEWWKKRSADKLKEYPYCQVCHLMSGTRPPATEVHHRTYDYFGEFMNDLVSCCKPCHLAYEQRRMRRNRR